MAKAESFISLKKPTVLLVDDDAGVRFTLAEILGEADLMVIEATDGRDAQSILTDGKSEIDLVITDLRMPKLDGMQLLKWIKEKHPTLKVIVITAHGSEAHAVQAMKLGAYDYFAKPFDMDQILGVVKRATESLRLDLENRQLRAQLALGRHMIFRSPAMVRVAEIVDRAAGRDVTVLINGESGTGKELVANALVSASPRANKPFLKFNCAAVPRELAESELFGHSAQAFTGAGKKRLGLFREADEGTLFLDEIAELDPLVQGKLLRVLQTGELKPVGEDREQRVDVRIIAATHRDLEDELKAGRFREDLFYRLHVVVLHLPPLRERPEDIEPLIDHFVQKYAERFGLKGCNLSPDLRMKLLLGDYKGNVRELENRIERLIALSNGGLIDEDISSAISTNASEPNLNLGLKERVEAFERGLILQELGRTAGNRSLAARRLKIGRVTLLDKMKKYGIVAMPEVNDEE